jgi:hypothetical protein
MRLNRLANARLLSPEAGRWETRIWLKSAKATDEESRSRSVCLREETMVTVKWIAEGLQMGIGPSEHPAVFETQGPATSARH